MTWTRRSVLATSLTALVGAGVAVGGESVAGEVGASGPLPLYGGSASAVHADRRTPPSVPRAPVVWGGSSARREIALTFDDGPMPDWTPRVLAALDEADAPATFFLRGDHVQAHSQLHRGSVGRHELANHTWDHPDLARLDLDACHHQLQRTHEVLRSALGTTATLFRPPYGHLGGASLLAAAEMGYTTVIWNRQMLESDFRDHPPGLTEHIVSSAQPGTILLAHDTGPSDRLVAIDQLPEMIAGLRARGFHLVTVSQLLAPEAQRTT